MHKFDIKVNCPVCKKPLVFSDQGATCPVGDNFEYREGVYSLLEKDLRVRVTSFLDKLTKHRESYIKTVNPELLKNLPYVSFDLEMWKLRTMDIEVIDKHISGKGNALDIGAWNGWLSNRLTERGYQVTAVDLFVHQLDGLAAKKYFDRDWVCLQMNMDDLSLLQGKYDLIVINRCLPYFSDPEKTLKILKSLLNPGGVLIITGITLYKNPEVVIKTIQEAEFAFREKFDHPLIFNRTKGYLERKDLAFLKRNGIQLRKYKKLIIKSLASFLKPTKPVYFYGIYIQ